MQPRFEVGDIVQLRYKPGTGGQVTDRQQIEGTWYYRLNGNWMCQASLELAQGAEAHRFVTREEWSREG